MKVRLLFLSILVLILSVFVVSAEAVSEISSGSSVECGLFCKMKVFFVELFGGLEKTTGNSYDQSNGEVDWIDEEDLGDIVEQDEDLQVEAESLALTTPIETMEDIEEKAIEEQIRIVEERVSPVTLQDVKNEELCNITFKKDEIFSDEMARGTFSFDESLYGEKVYLACDQYERYGISGDKLQEVTARSFGEKLNCDYGRVTIPTIYFYSASDGKDVDYCVAPITVKPLKNDEGECFSDVEIEEMKAECKENDKPSFEISDANGCLSIYCGWDYNVCPSEDLLEKATLGCESRGDNFFAYRYSEEVEGQDWPCAQIRCSECPTEEELSMKEENCLAQGDDVEPRREIDYEVTGCGYVICAPKEKAF